MHKAMGTTQLRSGMMASKLAAQQWREKYTLEGPKHDIVINQLRTLVMQDR